MPCYADLSLLLSCLPHSRSKPPDNPQSSTLTPKEIADGWLLLFDGETTFGWNIDGESSVANGMLKLGGERKCVARFTTPLDNFELQFDSRTKDAQAVGNFRVVRGDIRMQYGIPASRLDWCHATHKVTSDPVKGNLELVSESSYPNGNKVGSKNTQAVKAGPTVIEFDLFGPVSLRKVKLRPLDLKSIFNGKDLSGWKEHPGKKSKFSVENGAIRIQNGPGDLQSEGQWDDFVLQLECKVNGKHLNSGVFFRCRPGEYQHGYEAQIHNGFSEKPKEYTIDEYDPKTDTRPTRKESSRRRSITAPGRYIDASRPASRWRRTTNGSR